METNAIIHTVWALFWTVVVISVTYTTVKENQAKKEIELARIAKGKK